MKKRAKLPLAGMSAEEFLNRYWQKKPLLIRQAISNFEDPITPEELAGIACNESACARIVRETKRKKPWSVEHGPFSERDFANLPTSHWTVLVQEMEKWIPEIDALKDLFRFIPDWRTDDVMVSYAAPQGSVGPHIDQYDVFLLQGLGQRRWSIASAALEVDEFVPGLDLKILREFRPDQEWVLEAGDMLYLPPRIPHHGIAINPCMTYSIGFRSPSAGELLTAFVDSLGDEVDNKFFSDPNLKFTKQPGEISLEAVTTALDLLRSLPLVPEEAVHWFGRLVTQNRRHDTLPPLSRKIRSYQSLIQRRDLCNGLMKSPEVRFAYARLKKGGVALFVDGTEILVGTRLIKLVQQICDGNFLSLPNLLTYGHEAGSSQLILSLYNQGYLVPRDRE